MLEIKNLNKAFGQKVIFSDFSYQFSDLGLYVIKGNSGIGKTTLLRIISQIDKKYSGSIIGGGVKNVSFAFQEYRLFPNLTALENVTEVAFKKASQEDVFDAKNMLLELGFSESELSMFPDELSGGMKQRVSIARAILKNAPILLLDEPTKELDEALREKVISLIERESKKRLVIMVTHNEDEVTRLNPTMINLTEI